MKVAYLVNQYPKTSHTFVRREIHALEAQGIEVLRFSVRQPGEPLASEIDHLELQRTRTLLNEGVFRHILAALLVALRAPMTFLRALILALRLGRKSDRGGLLHLVYLVEACLLVRWLRREGVEHLHAHFGTNPAMVALLVRALGGPSYSFTVHGPDEFDKPEFLKLGEKIHYAAFVVAISSYGRAQLYRWASHEDWSKIQVVHCGVDEALLKAPATPVPEAPRLVCVARLSEQKGHLLLVEAAGQLAAQGIPFELLLAGDGPLRPQLEALIREKGLEDRVRIGGWMSGDQVREALLASRAMVLPSFAEGLPVVIMEALALGRPVVTTAIAGIPELVESGRTGWLVPAGSAEALVPAMKAALQAPSQQLGEMGRAGAALVAQHHDVNVEAARLADLFRRAAGRPDSKQLEQVAAPQVQRERAA
ncbi:MAG: glycosyltransferase [Myxococcaceae bacterium]